MNYPAKDIEKAKELKNKGYKWIARDKDTRVFVYKNKPVKYYKLGDWGDIETAFYYNVGNSFSSVTWEDTEPTSLDEIIASEKPKYKRLTDKDLVMNFKYNGQYDDMTPFFLFAQRLWELENKIESGELVFRED